MKKKETYYPLVPFEDETGNYGYKNPITGEVHIEPIYDDAHEFYEGVACVCIDGKYGVIDRYNNFLIPAIYNWAEDLYRGYFKVYDSDGPKVIDITGTIYLKPVQQDGLYGYADYYGSIIIPHQYEDASEFSEGLAAVKKDGKWGYINKADEVVIPLLYDEAEPFSEGLAVVRDGHGYNDYMFIDREGRTAFQRTFNAAYSFSDGMALVDIHDHWTYWDPNDYRYINKDGEVLDKWVDDTVFNTRFSCGRVAVYDFRRRRWGYMDRKGHMITPYQYEEIINMQFQDGYAIVQKNDLYGCIDMDGNEVVPCIYTSWHYDVVTFIKNHLESLKSD